MTANINEHFISTESILKAILKIETPDMKEETRAFPEMEGTKVSTETETEETLFQEAEIMREDLPSTGIEVEGHHSKRMEEKLLVLESQLQTIQLQKELFMLHLNGLIEVNL